MWGKYDLKKSNNNTFIQQRRMKLIIADRTILMLQKLYLKNIYKSYTIVSTKI